MTHTKKIGIKYDSHLLKKNIDAFNRMVHGLTIEIMQMGTYYEYVVTGCESVWGIKEGRGYWRLMPRLLKEGKMNW